MTFTKQRHSCHHTNKQIGPATHLRLRQHWLTKYELNMTVISKYSPVWYHTCAVGASRGWSYRAQLSSNDDWTDQNMTYLDQFICNPIEQITLPSAPHVFGLELCEGRNVTRLAIGYSFQNLHISYIKQHFNFFFFSEQHLNNFAVNKGGISR